eukprot:6379187-Pyramimonas_sp.AAC.1
MTGVACASKYGKAQPASPRAKLAEANIGARRFYQLRSESPHAAGLVSRNPREMLCSACKQKPAAWDTDQLRAWLQSPCVP